MRPGSWTQRGACRGVPTFIFYDPDLIDDARRICADCTVRIPCLLWATENEADGVWGGADEQTRVALRRIATVQGQEAFERAVDHVTLGLGRLVHGWPDDSPPTPARDCHRCGELVPGLPAGRSAPLDRNGPNATCGRVSTYNRGCRCIPCVRAKQQAQQRSPRGDERETMSDELKRFEEDGLPAQIFDDRALLLEDGIDLETWTRLGEALQRFATGHQWWVGDWLIYGEAHFGEEHAQAVGLGAIDYKTLMNWRWVASKIPPKIRRADVPWSIHRAAAELDDLEVIDRILEEARMQMLTYREAVALVKAEQVPELPAGPSSPPGPTRSVVAFRLSFSLPVEFEEDGRKVLDALVALQDEMLADLDLEPTSTSRAPS